jgi:hypothetical protein
MPLSILKLLEIALNAQGIKHFLHLKKLSGNLNHLKKVQE